MRVPYSKKSCNTPGKLPCSGVYKPSGPIYLRRLYSVTLTACAAVSQRALHKMVDTLDTDTFH